MPKRVDHDERKAQIIEALWRITTRGGLGAASFREVATEAGVSVSLVQYYFGTKDQLLLQSLFLLARRVATRTQARVASLGASATPRQVVAAVLDEFLATNDESRDAMLLFLAFQMAALTDPALARSEAAQVPEGLLTFLADQIRLDQESRKAKSTDHPIDPEKEAKVLVGVMVGLSTSVLAGNETPKGARAVLAYTLDRTFGPSPGAAARRR